MTDFFELRQVIDGTTTSVRKDGFELTRQQFWEHCETMEAALFGPESKPNQEVERSCDTCKNWAGKRIATCHEPSCAGSPHYELWEPNP